MEPYTKFIQKGEAVEAFCYMVMLPHNFEWLSSELQNLLSLYKIGRSIEIGDIIAFGNYNEQNALIGMIAGVIENNKWHVHVYSANRSGCNIADLGIKTQKLFKSLFPEVTKLIGAIPKINRAARIYALRNGFKHIGYDDNYLYLKNGIRQKVMIFEKEI